MAKTLPKSEYGAAVLCVTESGRRFVVSQSPERKRFTLWEETGSGYEKVCTGASPLSLYDKVPWKK